MRDVENLRDSFNVSVWHLLLSTPGIICWFLWFGSETGSDFYEYLNTLTFLIVYGVIAIICSGVAFVIPGSRWIRVSVFVINLSFPCYDLIPVITGFEIKHWTL